MKILYQYRTLYTRHGRRYAPGLVSLPATNGLVLLGPWPIKGAIDSLGDGPEAGG